MDVGTTNISFLQLNCFAYHQQHTECYEDLRQSYYQEKELFEKNNTGQGVCIIHKNNINIEILEQIQSTQPATNLQHSIQITTGNDQIQITTLYCPRKNPSKEIIEGNIQKNKNTIITGDFNSRHEELGQRQRQQRANIDQHFSRTQLHQT